VQHSHVEEVEIYSGPATIEHQNGQMESVKVRLWSIERMTNRPVLGAMQKLPSRRDVIGIQGEILSSLSPGKLMQLAMSPLLRLLYDQVRWKILFENTRNSRFKAFDEERIG
jgi:hypothetical protein